MKTLTLWQPWASLLVSLDKAGRPLKLVETRSWPTSYRGPLLIHAGRTNFEDPIICEEPCFRMAGISSIEDIARLPHGAIVGEVTLVDCVPIEQLYGSSYDTRQERAFGDWSPGRFGWIVAYKRAFANPINVRGKQGLWDFDLRPGEGAM